MMKDLEKLTPEAAYRHAVDVIKGRWSEAEELIMTNPEWASWYAHSVIKAVGLKLKRSS